MSFEVWWTEFEKEHGLDSITLFELAKRAYFAGFRQAKHDPTGKQLVGPHGGGMGTNVSSSGIEHLPGPR